MPIHGEMGATYLKVRCHLAKHQSLRFCRISFWECWNARKKMDRGMTEDMMTPGLKYLCITGHFWREYPSHRWIPLSLCKLYRGLLLLFISLNNLLVALSVIWDAITFTWHHCNAIYFSFINFDQRLSVFWKWNMKNIYMKTAFHGLFPLYSLHLFSVMYTSKLVNVRVVFVWTVL